MRLFFEGNSRTTAAADELSVNQAQTPHHLKPRKFLNFVQVDNLPSSSVESDFFAAGFALAPLAKSVVRRSFPPAPAWSLVLAAAFLLNWNSACVMTISTVSNGSG